MDYQDIKEFIHDIIGYIIVIGIVILIIVYVFTFSQVVGPSMNPTLNEGDITVLLKSHYLLFDVKRSDIISFTYDEGKYLIKRVIGLPGENVYIKNNKVYINNKELDEKYLPDDIINEDFSLNDLGYEKIPEGYYLCLGDNRTNSMDSRDSRVGLVNIKNIKGKIVFRVFPFNGMRGL